MRDLSELRKRLYNELPELASELIRSPRYRNPSDPFREAYANAPDDPEMHAPRWHQWGVITHTRQVGRQFEEVLPEKLAQWFGAAAAGSRMGLLEETIEDLSKWELLLTAVPTHDWGKFTLRSTGRHSAGRPKFSFGGHEYESGELVKERAATFEGVSALQLQYLSRCAALHFELGKVRDRARSQGGYNLAWVRGEGFLEAVDRVLRRHPGFEREIGLFYLADNWGKTDLMDSTEFSSDEALARLRPEVERQIKERGLERRLIDCALQLPVTTAVGRRYLEQFV